MVEPYESRRQKKPTGAVKPNAMPSPVDPFSVALTPQNFNEVWGARKAQVAGSMPALAPRSPVQMPAMPANPSPLGTYANPDRGGYRFGFPQQDTTPAPMPSPVRGAQQQAATLAQSFDRLRERSKAVPFGTYLAGTPETIGNLTQARPWIDPAKTTTETMTWPEYVMKNRAQMAAMQQGRPFDLTPAWIGSSGRQTPPTTWDLAKQKSGTTGEGTVAEAIRSRAAERRLKEEPRRAMVTAKAQGRMISPVQAGIESAMAGGQQLTDDQLRAMYGPVFDEIRARERASTVAALGTALSPGDGMPADVAGVMRAFAPFMPGSGQTSVLPWMQGGQDNSPLGMVSGYLAMHPELSESFYKKLSDPNADEESLTRDLRLAGMPQEEIDRFLEAYTGKAKKPAVPYKDSIRQGLADMGKIGITTPGTPR